MTKLKSVARGKHANLNLWQWQLKLINIFNKRLDISNNCVHCTVYKIDNFSGNLKNLEIYICAFHLSPSHKNKYYKIFMLVERLSLLLDENYSLFCTLVSEHFMKLILSKRITKLSFIV